MSGRGKSKKPAKRTREEDEEENAHPPTPLDDDMGKIESALQAAHDGSEPLSPAAFELWNGILSHLSGVTDALTAPQLRAFNRKFQAMKGSICQQLQELSSSQVSQALTSDLRATALTIVNTDINVQALRLNSDLQSLRLMIQSRTPAGSSQEEAVSDGELFALMAMVKDLVAGEVQRENEAAAYRRELQVLKGQMREMKQQVKQLQETRSVTTSKVTKKRGVKTASSKTLAQLAETTSSRRNADGDDENDDDNVEEGDDDGGELKRVSDLLQEFVHRVGKYLHAGTERAEGASEEELRTAHIKDGAYFESFAGGDSLAFWLTEEHLGHLFNDDTLQALRDLSVAQSRLFLNELKRLYKSSRQSLFNEIKMLVRHSKNIMTPVPASRKILTPKDEPKRDSFRTTKKFTEEHDKYTKQMQTQNKWKASRDELGLIPFPQILVSPPLQKMLSDITVQVFSTQFADADLAEDRKLESFHMVAFVYNRMYRGRNLAPTQSGLVSATALNEVEQKLEHNRQDVLRWLRAAKQRASAEAAPRQSPDVRE